MSSKRKEKNGTPGTGFWWLIRVLMVGAIGISSYLAWTSLRGSAVAGCGPDSGCDKVLHSRWAYWLGIPVSVPALLLYLGVIGITFRMNDKTPSAQQRKLWLLLMGASVLIVGVAIWFTSVQQFILHSLCPYCLTAHGLGVVAATILLARAPIRAAPEKPWQAEKQVFIVPRLARNMILFALAGVALLVVGQTLHTPKSFAVAGVPQSVLKSVPPILTTSIASASVTTSASPSAVPEPVVKTASPPESVGANVVDHRFQLYRGMFQFDLRDEPLIGSSEASHAMLSLFDYTCHHCRATHPLLVEVQRALGNQLAIVSLPMPLDGKCNPTVRRTPAAHTNACEYAQLGLIVWRANQEKQPQFDDYIFAGEKPPPLSDAVAFARQLVGTEAFAKASSDPWVPQRLFQSISIYSTNYLHVHNGSMPQIMINTNLTTGTLDSTADLFKVLDKQLGLRPGS